MTGLRARQKADRHRRILAAASRLFRRRGYDAVRIDEIAGQAQVSIGTIYNYYENKGDLLMAIVAMEVNDVLAAGEKIIARPPKSARRSVEALMATYIEHSLVYLSKEMWRQAMAIAIQQPKSPFGVSYGKLDAALADQTSRLVEKMQALGLVRPGVDARALGELMFNNTNMMFTIFVKADGMRVDALLRRISRQLRPVIEAAAPKERPVPARARSNVI
jgi:AcrR family transcriptional regulator